MTEALTGADFAARVAREVHLRGLWYKANSRSPIRVNGLGDYRGADCFLSFDREARPCLSTTPHSGPEGWGQGRPLSREEADKLVLPPDVIHAVGLLQMALLDG